MAVLLVVGFAFSLANPSAVYCEELGYEYRIADTPQGQNGVCVLPDGSEVDPWDFLAGSVGGNYSYCVQNGYGLVAGEGMATCILPNGSNASVSELMDLSGGGGLVPPEHGEAGGEVPVPISVGESNEEESGEGMPEGEEAGEEVTPEEGAEEGNLTVLEEDMPTVIGVGGGLETAEEAGPTGGAAVIVLAVILVAVGISWIIFRKETK